MFGSRRSWVFGVALIPLAALAPRCEEVGIGLHDARTAAEKRNAVDNAKRSTQQLVKRGMSAEQDGITKTYVYQPAKQALGDKVGELFKKIGEKMFGNEESADRASHMADRVFQSYEDTIDVNEAANRTPVDANDAIGNKIAAENCAYHPGSCAKPGSTSKPSAVPTKAEHKDNRPTVTLPSYNLTPLDGGPR